MTNLISDFRIAVRTLWKAPLFTTLTVVSLALGIGANTTIFTLLDQVVLRKLPVDRPDELVQLTIDGAFNGNSWGDGSELSYPMYLEFRDQNAVFSGIFARFDYPMHVGTGRGIERVNGELVSGTYFPTLRVAAAAGRLFTSEDDMAPGGHPVAVLSFDYWKTRFSGDPGIVGRKLTVNSHPFTVSGVAAERFTGIDVGSATQIFVPMMMKAQMTPGWNYLDDRRARFARVFARLKPGETPESATAALQPSFKAQRAEELKAPFFAKATDFSRREFQSASIKVAAAPQGHSGTRTYLTEPLWTLMAIVIGVLLIAGANVAGLMLARGVSRQREMAIRLAVGGTRYRILRQLVVESLVLASAGAGLGLLMATWGTSLLLALFVDNESAIAISASPDARVLVFNFALGLVAGLIVGLVPAWQTTRPDLAPTLKEQSGSVVSGGSVRMRKAIVVIQVALSLLLLIGAGLFVRSLSNLLAQDPGFEPANLVAFNLEPSLNGYESDKTKRLASTLIERLAATPGVDAAGISGRRILDGGSWNSTLSLDGHAAKPGEPVVSYNHVVMPGYFTAMRIPLLRGRDFTEHDAYWGATTDRREFRVAIANRKFVERYIGTADPIGRRVGFGGDPGTATPIEIVGVVGTSKYVALRDEAEPQLFFPILETSAPPALSVYVRTRQEPTAFFETLRRTMRELDASLPVFQMVTMEQQVNRSVTNERMIAGLSSVLGVLASLLAVIGLYGVMAYTVTRRTREIGIRMALGARAQGVAWLFVREAVVLVGLGFLIAVPAAWALGRYVESLLYGLKPADPLTTLTAMFALAAIAALGAAVPARRATRINPLTALREE
jgi:predicted permease